MILATARVEALDESNPLNQLRLALQSKGKSIEMELAPLEKSDVASLARDLTGGELDDAKIDSLFAETEGNPFFVVEMLRSGGRFGERGEIVGHGLHRAHDAVRGDRPAGDSGNGRGPALEQRPQIVETGEIAEVSKPAIEGRHGAAGRAATVHEREMRGCRRIFTLHGAEIGAGERPRVRVGRIIPGEDVEDVFKPKKR